MGVLDFPLSWISSMGVLDFLQDYGCPGFSPCWIFPRIMGVLDFLLDFP